MIDLNGYTLGVTRDDGTDINVDIVPVTMEIDGQLVSTGVYNLFLLVDGEGDPPLLGTISFNVEDKFDWQYIDDYLSENEADQVAQSIQRHLN
jgi:hypothetical protein